MLRALEQLPFGRRGELLKGRLQRAFFCVLLFSLKGRNKKLLFRENNYRAQLKKDSRFTLRRRRLDSFDFL